MTVPEGGRAAAPRRRVAIAGASGRMGRTLIEAVVDSDDLSLAAAFDVAGSPGIGGDATAFLGRSSGVAIGADPRAALAVSEVLIDFTRPQGTLAHLALCRELGVAAVVGTTGFDAAQKAEIAAHAEHIAIVETHHRMKVDAPSDTALRMGEVVAAAQGKSLDSCAVYDRDGERRPGSIGFASLRGGDIVGDHTVLFAGAGERIEITHRSTSRATYAEGSLRAARFVLGRKAGLFGMDYVLGMR